LEAEANSRRSPAASKKDAKSSTNEHDNTAGHSEEFLASATASREVAIAHNSQSPLGIKRMFEIIKSLDIQIKSSLSVSIKIF